jgi:hypothetical protein
MCSGAAAAGGQARVIVSQGRGKRAEQEDEKEQNGSATPHMGLSVHEYVAMWGEMGWARQAFSYHQGIARVLCQTSVE